MTAILAQFAIVILLLLTATFQTAVNYIQFSLTLCSTLTVLGVFVLRWRRPNLPRPYRTWGYPVTPATFSGHQRLDAGAHVDRSLHARTVS